MQQDVLQIVHDLRVRLTAAGVDHSSCADVVVVVVALQRNLAAELLEPACGALWRLVCDGANNLAACAAAGGVEALVQVLQVHRAAGPAGLLEVACKALARTTVVRPNAARCGAAGGGNAVVGVLSRAVALVDGGGGAPASGLLYQACLLLRNITTGNVSNQAQCGAAGGVELAVGVLRRYVASGPAAAGLLEHASAAVWSLTASIAINQTKCEAAQGAEILVDVLRRNATLCPVGLSEQAVGALWSIALPNAGIRARFASAGGVAVLRHVMQQHPNNRAVASRCQALISRVFSAS